MRTPTQLAFVTSEKDHTITVVDVRTLTVAGTIATCKRPRHIQPLPGGARVLVACSDSGQGDVIDLASRKSVGRVPLGEDPEAFDLSPDGKLAYVSAEEDGALHVFDLAAKKQVRSVKVGEEPEGVKTAPDGKRIYVTSEVANMVHVIDAQSYAVIKNIPVGKRPRRFAFSADGAELWVSNELGASVSILSTRDLAVVATLPFEVKGMRPDDITPVGIERSRDGKTMYVGLGKANHVAFVDIATRKVTQQVLVGKRAWGLGLNRDGSRLFVVNGLSDDMTVVDTAAAKALKTLPVGRVPYGVAPGGAHAAELRIGVLQRADDERLEPKRLEQAYPGHPGGPLLQSVEVAVKERSFELEAAKLQVKLELREVRDAADAKAQLQQLEKAGVAAAVLDLPAAWIAAAGPAVRAAERRRARRGAAPAGLPAEPLPHAARPPHARRRRGPDPGGAQVEPGAAAARADAGRRGAPRAGAGGAEALRAADGRREALQAVRRPARARPRQPAAADRRVGGRLRRGLGGRQRWRVRAQAALCDGAAAPGGRRCRAGGRGLGAALRALSRRFQRAAQRPMTAYDWAGYLAAKAVLQAALEQPARPDAAAIDKALRAEGFTLDGFKGVRLSFRPWDRQLRQPLLMTDGLGVISTAPVDGMMHPKNALDTLGTDAAEPGCKARP
ncbi:PQQ-dependent catabolism-associated beta-propeller protein [Piscinibacter sakaiensis]|uniref:PQQ-dependent catabolism-associated beta-propeller protein n=1 Tax=Piscinibacter sakaiensis TaxID=1547922 RepID=UPI00372718E3